MPSVARSGSSATPKDGLEPLRRGRPRRRPRRLALVSVAPRACGSACARRARSCGSGVAFDAELGAPSLSPAAIEAALFAGVGLVPFAPALPGSSRAQGSRPRVRRAPGAPVRRMGSRARSGGASLAPARRRAPGVRAPRRPLRRAAACALRSSAASRSARALLPRSSRGRGTRRSRSESLAMRVYLVASVVVVRVDRAGRAGPASRLALTSSRRVSCRRMRPKPCASGVEPPFRPGPVDGQ